ncbi:MAG: hypothetical protein QNK23_14625 [Crocinitomicaceae bacterium]|nr:hypothetical protein [Crocinitomicaceae bacterium]
MKHILQFGLILSLTILFGTKASAQTNWNLAAGYYAESTTSPGIVIELEREKFHSDLLSIPIQFDVIGFLNPEYSGISLELKSGYRKYFNNGLFIEQTIGVGYQFTKYTRDMWYVDKYHANVPHGNSIVPWFTASTSVGVGYNLTHKKDVSHLIWFRPKLTWLPGFRGLHLPYHAFQIGYTYNLKSKK